MWWYTVTHRWGSEGKTDEWSGLQVLFTLPRNMACPALLPLMHTPWLPVVDWTDSPRRFKWTRPVRRKTKSGFCACAVTFQLASTFHACQAHIAPLAACSHPLPFCVPPSLMSTQSSTQCYSSLHLNLMILHARWENKEPELKKPSHPRAWTAVKYLGK